jgi:exosortase family protein XrtF
MPTASSKKWFIFIVSSSIVYLSWVILYDRYLQPQTNIDEQIIILIIAGAKQILQVLGYKTFVADSDFGAVRVLGIDGTGGLWIGDNCDGIKLFGLFSIFVLCFPSAIKHKLWFIPLGILIIHLANILRVALLCIILAKHPDWLNFNHTYTFTFLVYSIIFILWIWFINRFSLIIKHETTVE